MNTNELEALIESYLNGNLTVTRAAINKEPHLQTEIYIALPGDAKDLFMTRCRAWHNEVFTYSKVGV